VKRLSVALVLFIVCGCAHGSMTSYRLYRDAGSLGSCAGEGQLLSHVAATGRGPSAYIATHASEVGADCGDLASVIASTTPEPNTAEAREKLLRLALRAQTLLEQLEQDPNDAASAANLEKSFTSIADQASKLQGG
jgi:ATP-dependent helicase YprA (DUF1998 family)